MRSLLASVLALLLGAALPAQAHKASDSFVAVDVEGASITVRWDIALRDLDAAIGTLEAQADAAQLERLARKP